jgi:hypothetical protein
MRQHLQSRESSPEPRRLPGSSVDHIPRSELLQKLLEDCNQEHQIIAICQHFTRTAMRSLTDEAVLLIQGVGANTRT